MEMSEYVQIVKNVCLQLDIQKPDETVIRNITQYCKNLNIVNLKDEYLDAYELYEFIASKYVESISVQEVDIDHNEYMQSVDNVDEIDKELYNEAKTSTQPLIEWLSNRMPVLTSKSTSILIDSINRNAVQDSESFITNFNFTLATRSNYRLNPNGVVPVRIIPTNVTYIKVGRIILPYNAVTSVHNYTHEITLTFTALQSNGIITNDGTYHIAFTYKACDWNNDLVELTPINEFCKFVPPLRMLDDISIRFNDPYYPVEFPIDRMYPSSFNYLSSDGRINFNSNHNLNDNDVIIVKGLTTLNDNNNASVLSMINNRRGIAITKISDTSISTGIDFSTIVNPDTDSIPLILFYSHMFKFPIEIGYQGMDGDHGDKY